MRLPRQANEMRNAAPGARAPGQGPTKIQLPENGAEADPAEGHVIFLLIN
jgi:hypothetical protein